MCMCFSNVCIVAYMHVSFIGQSMYMLLHMPSIIKKINKKKKNKKKKNTQKHTKKTHKKKTTTNVPTTKKLPSVRRKLIMSPPLQGRETYCFSPCVCPSVHLSVRHKSCPLYNLKTVKDFSMKLGTLVNHDETVCHAQEP